MCNNSQDKPLIEEIDLKCREFAKSVGFENIEFHSIGLEKKTGKHTWIYTALEESGIMLKITYSLMEKTVVKFEQMKSQKFASFYKVIMASLENFIEQKLLTGVNETDIPSNLLLPEDMWESFYNDLKETGLLSHHIGTYMMSKNPLEENVIIAGGIKIHKLKLIRNWVK